MTKEIWKPAVGWEGLYSVSNYGRVRRDKVTQHAYRGRDRKPQPGRNGYLQVFLYNLPKKQKPVYVHKLVMDAFIGPCPDGLEINHIDLDKSNNRLDNLEYITHLENMRHAFKAGVVKPPRGEDHGAAILTEADVLEMRALRKQGWLYREIAEHFGGTMLRTSIRGICAGNIWKHLPL